MSWGNFQTEMHGFHGEKLVKKGTFYMIRKKKKFSFILMEKGVGSVHKVFYGGVY